jgi:CMP-N-acetylneuraminic acid synthetase
MRPASITWRASVDSPRVYAVIPARGGSKRLPRKNIHEVWGQPMLSWAIRACQASAYISECFVSTEDDEIAAVAEKFGATVIWRPAELATDMVFKQDVIVHAAESFAEKPDIVVSLQANSPEICASDLDAAIAKLIEFDRSEIFSVDANLLQNAAFRIMKYEYVFQKSISTRSGAYVTQYVDVHSPADIEELNTNRKPCAPNKESAHA